MPIVTSPVDVSLHANAGGFTIRILADTPTEIDSKFLPDALAKKLTIVDEVKTPNPGVRALELEEALEQIVLLGNPDDFNTVTGVPKVAPVSALTGTKVTAKEIAETWEKMELPTLEV